MSAHSNGAADAGQTGSRAGSRDHRRPAAGNLNCDRRETRRHPHRNEHSEASSSRRVPARFGNPANTEATEQCVLVQAGSGRRTSPTSELGVTAWSRLWDLLLFSESSGKTQDGV